MKYIITESQYNTLIGDNILKLNFDIFNNDWDILQRFLEKKGNPPYGITGKLNLQKASVKSLGRLRYVERGLYLSYTDVESLGDLEYVGGGLFLPYTKIKDLGNLKYVGGPLSLKGTKIKSLGNLQYVGDDLNIEKTPLLKTTTEEEIKQQIKVGGYIYLE